MTTFLPRALSLPRTSLAIGATAVAVLSIGIVNTDSLIERSFATALAERASGPGARTASSFNSVSGSEEFWLRGTRLPGTAPVSWSKPAAVEGERITITAGGRDVVLEVVDVRPLGEAGIDSAVTRIDTRESPTSLVVVTCREVGAKADARPIRFLVEPNAALPWRALGTPSQAL